MTGDPTISYDVTDHVAVIRLNRPEKLNALTTAMADEHLPALCRQAEVDTAVRVVVITGTGRGFCSGADVGERLTDVSEHADTTALQRPLAAFVESVWSIPKPVIAAVNGVAAGGGLSLAAAADFRIVAESARFTPAFVRRGLMPDGGLTLTLPLLIGLGPARRMLLTGEEVDARRALSLGLADEVVADGDLMQRSLAFAAELAAGPPVALSFTKRALQRSGIEFANQLAYESWGQRVCLGTRDFAEGRAAFVERRQPVFEGR